MYLKKNKTLLPKILEYNQNCCVLEPNHTPSSFNDLSIEQLGETVERSPH